MALTVKETGGNGGFDPIPAGVHRAVCCGIIDLGTQYNKVYDKAQHRVMIQFELPDERIEFEKDGQKQEGPRLMSKEYTASLGAKANLRKDLEAWRGRAFTKEELDGFDLANIMGKGCMLNVVHNENNGKTYANINGIMPLYKGMEPPQAEKQLSFSFDEDGDSIPADLPQWIVDKIMAAQEFNHGKPSDEAPREGAFAKDSSAMDDVPF